MLLVLVSVTLPRSGKASILGSNKLIVSFTSKVDAESQASWSPADKLTVTPDGLGRDGDGNSLVPGWFQSKSFAIGYSWRPTVSAMIRATITPAPHSFLLPNGNPTTAQPGNLFVRYSPDNKHWSSWHSLQQDMELWNTKKEVAFKASIQVPNRDREDYQKLLQEYAKQDVPWSSDEDAAVRWIIAKNPKFFEGAIPFMGYVQFLYECNFYGGQRITGFNAEIGYGMSGFMAFPRDKELKQGLKKPWHYQAE